jgi:hypothetical protein
MSGNAHERRTERRRFGNGNYLQMVFDVLRASPELMTKAEVEAATRLDPDTVDDVLQRLREIRALITVRQADRAWRYGIRESAERPIDRRKFKARQMEQAA